MSDFSDTNWADSEFAREYLDNAEAYVPFRQEMLKVLGLYYRNFLLGANPRSVLDLGCGDGILSLIVLGLDENASVTLVDGSQEMLDQAAERLGPQGNLNYLRFSFQELVRDDPLESSFDLVMSSLAIHHLNGEDKTSLYKYIFSRLKPAGHFINIDVVLAPTGELENWYMQVWEEWIVRRKSEGKTDRDFTDIVRRYQENPDNVPDTLSFQLKELERIGYVQVDCFYKHGVFVIFGGRKT
jgi:tRNA (cmo5U34)-methyltransferase